LKKILIIFILVFLAVAGWVWLRPLQSGDGNNVVGNTEIETVVGVQRYSEHGSRQNMDVAGVIRAERGIDSVTEVDDVPATNAVEDNIEGVIPDEYILSFYSDADREEFIRQAEKLGATILDRMDLGNSIRLRADIETLQKLKDNAPAAVELVRNREMNNTPLPILDPEAPAGSYNMFGNGVLAWMGVRDNDGWGKGVKVAVLDSGINNHSALAGVNVTRLDMLGGDGKDPATSGAHGTSVASLIAGNNEFMRGIAPDADILGIRVIGENGKGDLFTVAKGVVAAVDAGASIINLSMGSRSDSYILRDAVDYATEHGVVIVAATGNESSYGISFPAGYDDVVAVPAIDAAGRHMYFSNRGAAADIAAPGLGINAAGPDNSMALFSGTSASAPIISGAIAAIMSLDPDLSAAEARDILIEYSDDGGEPGPDEELGDGYIDMRRVLERDKEGIYDIAVNTPYLSAIEPGSDIALVVSLQNRGTEKIGSVKLIVNIDGARYSVFFNDIYVGETVSDSFTVPSSSLQVEGNLDVSAEAVIMDESDDYPNNNYMRINVYYAVPEE
jgi:hypothetical protein